MAHYFGDSARDVFFSQYHHLARHRLIEGDSKNNFTKKAHHANHRAKRETGSGSIARVALQPRGLHDVDFPFAPRRPNTAAAALGQTSAVPSTEPMHASIESTFGNQSSFLFDDGNHSSMLASLDGPTASVLSSFYDPHKKTKRNSEDPDPTSPRTTYLEGCLNSGLKPRASLILRKNVTTEVNLKV